MEEYTITSDELFRDGKKQYCPYQQPYQDSSCPCGSWCPLFEITDNARHNDCVILHCCKRVINVIRKDS